MGRLFDMMNLGFPWLLCRTPVVTIGPATTVFCSAASALVRGKDLFSYLLHLNACMELRPVFPEQMEKLEAARSGARFHTDGTLDETSGTDGCYTFNPEETAYEKEFNENTGDPPCAVIISNTEHSANSCFLLQKLIK